jgi:hypothetical protein
MVPDDPPTPGEESDATISSYREGDRLVICDRTNPRAWIKSDVTVSVGGTEPVDEEATPGKDGEARP